MAHRRRQVRFSDSAVKDGDLVSLVHEGAHETRTEDARPADDEDAHDDIVGLRVGLVRGRTGGP